jgi:5-methylthioadenosine/S-adenosylhomocysteine deaminase
MASSLIRGKYVIPAVISRTEARVIEDGAVFQRDGKVVEVGSYRDLAERHRPDEVIGSAAAIITSGSPLCSSAPRTTPLSCGSPSAWWSAAWTCTWIRCTPPSR